jgi:lipoyl synthase
MKKLQIPSWLKRQVGQNKRDLRSESAKRTANDLCSDSLNTVCEQALCPNKGECFKNGDATFLILGKNCTRTCSFCAVSSTKPLPPNPDEPKLIAQTVKKWKLNYCVLTSPTRDDLSDGGATHYANVIREVKAQNPDIKVEPLVPDFKGSKKSIKTVLNSNPEVFAHNMETVPSLYSKIRPEADYKRSLDVLKISKELRPDILTKSGLMLGLGETLDEVIAVLKDLRDINCDMLTLGQYLQPSDKHYPVQKYLSNEEFNEYGQKARELGFLAVMSTPLTRSSYLAGKLYNQAVKNET